MKSDKETILRSHGYTPKVKKLSKPSYSEVRDQLTLDIENKGYNWDFCYEGIRIFTLGEAVKRKGLLGLLGMEKQEKNILGFMHIHNAKYGVEHNTNWEFNLWDESRIDNVEEMLKEYVEKYNVEIRATGCVEGNKFEKYFNKRSS